MHVEQCRKLMVWMVIFAFFFAGVTPAYSGSRILPTGKVNVFEGIKLVQVLKQESAFPNGALLTTEGKCGVRLQNFYLVAQDGSTFGIMEGLNRMDLRVDKGEVYFAITQDTGKLAFLTPAGVLSTVQIRLNAAANGGLLKGYLDVSRNQAQLGVLEGGSMVVSTSNGDRVIRSGKQITLAFADPLGDDDNKKEPKAEESKAVKETGGKIPKGVYIAGGALLGLGLLGLGGSGGSGPGAASPILPAPAP